MQRIRPHNSTRALLLLCAAVALLPRAKCQHGKVGKALVQHQAEVPAETVLYFNNGTAVPGAQRVRALNLDKHRKFLVVAAIGDNSVHAISWLDRAPARAFDLMGMYYGSEASFACESCDSLYLMQGTKWGQIDLLSQSKDWGVLLQTYATIMFADDDLGMSTHVLNRAFEIFEEQELQLAQPSVCRHPNSGSQQPLVHQKEGLLLRHTAFVEIMAPMFSTAVLRGPLAQAMRGGHSGWGLDHVWPHLLGYPHKGIAIIDEVCMTHPIQQPNKQSVYARKRPDGLDPWGEYTMLRTRYGSTEAAWRRAGIPGVLGTHVWSEVPLPAPSQHPERERASPALAPLPTPAEGQLVADGQRLVHEAQLLGDYRAPYAVAHIRLVHVSELTPALAGASGCLALGGMLGALWARRRYRRHGELSRLGCKGLDRGGSLARINTSPSLPCYKLPL